MAIKLCIFDLDGVICDTAKYHYLAWKELADEMQIPFTLKDNERLKGVSRMPSLDIILSLGGKEHLSEDEKETLATRKNTRYVEMISKMEKDEILPGVENFLKELHAANIKVALGSASKNTGIIMERLGLREAFDYIVDGTMIVNTKPDPEVFVKSMEYYGLSADECIVFEDAAAGIEAGHRGGIRCVGIGTKEDLPEADYIMPGFADVSYETIRKIFEEA